MGKTRIQVYADTETKRRIEVAALRRNVPVTEYCLGAIRQRLAEDGVLEADHVRISVSPDHSADTVDALRSLHEQILADRDGELIDLDDVLDQVRQERENEILRLR